MKSSIPKPARPVGAAVPPWDDDYKNHSIEGKLNGWRGLFDQLTGLCYNRHGGIASNTPLMIERLSNSGINSRFIDVEIMGMREKKGIGTIVVIDAFDPANPKPYSERMKELDHIEEAPFDLPKNRLLRMPRLNHATLKESWEKMNKHNIGGLLWEGFVMKADEPYEWLSNPSYCSPSWHKWRIL